jgi:hypothetical protein
MAKRYGLSAMLVFLCLVLCASVSWAQWVKDGVPVCIADNYQTGPKTISDGEHGAVIVWMDYRSGNDWDIYGNRIGADGRVFGPPTGVPVCTASGFQQLYDVIPDGTGGAIVLWADDREGTRYIYVQRVDGSGVARWAENGIRVCPSTAWQDWGRLVPDGTGGAIVTWHDTRNGNYDIFAQRIDGDGNNVWTSDGVPVCTQGNDQLQPEMVADGSGGAIIIWMDYRNGSSDIYAQRIDGEGGVHWGADGSPVCTAGNGKSDPRLIATPSGGAYVGWVDYRNGYSDAYVQLIDQDGQIVWPSDGTAVCPGSWNKYFRQLTGDGSGGIIVVWSDERTGAYTEVYAQRIDPDGNNAWPQYGTRVFPSYQVDSVTSVMADGNGGAIVAASVLFDNSSPSDIYVQKVDHDGNLLWGPKGSPACGALNSQYHPDLAPDGFGGAIVAWEDSRLNGNYSDIYCQRVGPSGLWGNPEPRIVSCLDVPGDQGGWVRIRTRASSHDAAGEYDSPIMGYNVWRMIAGGPRATSAGTAKAPADRSKLLALLADPATAKGVLVSGSEAGSLGLPPVEWESVGSWFATRDTLYNTVVPTKNDSTEAGIPREIFIVTAHTSMAGVFIASEPDTGYSVDNLAPGLTPGFAGAETASPNGLALSWTSNSASDIGKYNVYRGADALFVPDVSNLLGSTDATTLFDPGWVKALQYFYKLVAVDRHGNAGPAALLKPEDVRVGTMLQSFAASLSGPFVEITWKVSEAGADIRFVVLREETAGGAFEEIAAPQIDRDGLSFSMSDRSCEPGTSYRYRIDVADETGRRTLFETDAISTPALPLTLYQNHPNPFNPSTAISYYVPVAGQVTLDVYDSSGRLVVRLASSERQSKGTHSVEWQGLDASGRTVSSGVYFYRLTSGKETISKKMVLLR